MKFWKTEPEPGRVEKIKRSVQCHAAGAAQRVQIGVADATPKVKERVTGVSATVSGRAQDVARNAADAAHNVAGFAQTAAGTASSAAQTVAVKTRPARDEAVTRGTAAWSILRYGAPKPSLAMSLAAVPLAAAGKVGSTMTSKRGSAAALAAAGGVATMGVLWWRRSRADSEGLWITDPGASADDDEPRAGWHESPAPGVRAGDAKSVSASEKPVDCVDPETCRDPAHTWP
jgi:hypothetical protein